MEYFTILGGVITALDCICYSTRSMIQCCHELYHGFPLWYIAMTHVYVHSIRVFIDVEYTLFKPKNSHYSMPLLPYIVKINYSMMILYKYDILCDVWQSTSIQKTNDNSIVSNTIVQGNYVPRCLSPITVFDRLLIDIICHASLYQLW